MKLEKSTVQDTRLVLLLVDPFDNYLTTYALLNANMKVSILATFSTSDGFPKDNWYLSALHGGKTRPTREEMN